MQRSKANRRSLSIARKLASHAAMGVALGLGFCLLAVLIDTQLASLIAHNVEPKTTAIILVSFFTLIFGAGATFTGLVLAQIKRH